MTPRHRMPNRADVGIAVRAGGMVTAAWLRPSCCCCLDSAFPLQVARRARPRAPTGVVRSPIASGVLVLVVLALFHAARFGSGSCSTMSCNWAGSTEVIAHWCYGMAC